LRSERLTALDADDRAVVVHVEDEPAEVYAQLAAQGLVIGAAVHVLAHTSTQIRLEVMGDEQVVAPIVAANVSVRRLEKPEAAFEDHVRLSQIPSGAKARVIGILPTCRGVQRRRLLDLGIVPGTEVETELVSMGGDPVAYRIRGALIALRKSQADAIQVDRINEGARQGVSPRE
jgi:DtxR family Mn-dependent transcriptional regulator